MSGWIACTVDLADKPEIRSIAKTLGVPRAHAIGMCVMVWAWADRQTADGFVPLADLGDVDDVSQMAGFGAAMRDAGWAACKDGGVLFPNWDRWNRASAKKRLLDSERKRKARGHITDSKRPRPR